MGGLKYTTQLNMLVPPSDDNHVIRVQDVPDYAVTSPDDTVLTMKYTTNAADPMENGELRFVSDPNLDPEPYDPATVMILIPNPATGMVLESDSKGQAIESGLAIADIGLLIPDPATGMVLEADVTGQAIESDLAISDIALLKDKFALRLSSGAINVSVPNGATYQLLQGMTMSNITLSANVNPSDWAINAMSAPNPGTAIVFPAFSGWVDYRIDVRLTGTCNVSGNVIQEFSVALQRQNANTTAAAQGLMVSGNSNNLTMKSVLFSSYTNSLTDPFIQGGVQLRLNNTMGDTIVLTQVDVIINGAILTRG